MKKLLTLILTSLFFFGYAQRDFVVADPKNDLTPFTDGQTIQYTFTLKEIEANFGQEEIKFTIINESSKRIEMHTLRTNVEIVEGVNPYVCFGTCFDSTVMAISWPLDAGRGENYEFHFWPNGKTGFNKFKFEFWTKEDKSDLFTLHLEITILPGNSIKERNEQITLSAYPNPASLNSNITVSYSVDNAGNNLVIRNILGAIVMSMPLNPYENTISIDATNLKAGIYFYAIENKSRIVAAKKLIIK